MSGMEWGCVAFLYIVTSLPQHSLFFFVSFVSFALQEAWRGWICLGIHVGCCCFVFYRSLCCYHASQVLMDWWPDCPHVFLNFWGEVLDLVVEWGCSSWTSPYMPVLFCRWCCFVGHWLHGCGMVPCVGSMDSSAHPGECVPLRWRCEVLLRTGTYYSQDDTSHITRHLHNMGFRRHRGCHFRDPSSNSVFFLFFHPFRVESHCRGTP